MNAISPWLIRLSGDDASRIRLFCFHFAGGSALAFRSWAQFLPSFIEVIAIQLPARDGRYGEPALTNIPQILDGLIPELTPYLDKPYLVFGHSLGALIGYELIRAQRRLRLKPPELFIPSAHRAPHLPARAAPTYDLSDEEFLVRLEAFDGTSREVLDNQELMAAFLPRIRSDFRILETYVRQPQAPIDIPILAILGQDDPHVSETELRGWGEHTGNFRYRLFPGGHFFIETAKPELLNLIKHECEILRSHLPTEESDMLAYLFPGQGSQYKGMGGVLFDEFPELVEQADGILGYSVKALCLEDRENNLGKTQYTQPALFVVNALTYRKRIRDTGEFPAYCAGHSLGEYCALYAAGALGFEDGLRLVKKRGELMSRASGGAMAAILNLDESSLRQCLIDHGLTDIDIANYNSASQIVISGSKDHIVRAEAPIAALGAGFHPLNTSGAFHSRYMEDAKREFREYLGSFRFAGFRCPVIANVDARPYRESAIVETLSQQITGSVHWKESIEYLLRQGVTRFEEIGPGEVLTKLVGHIGKTFRAEEVQEERTFESVEQRIDHWNKTYPIGTKVRVKGYDGPLETRTSAILLFGHRAAIYMKNYNGYFDLDDVMPLARA